MSNGMLNIKKELISLTSEFWGIPKASVKDSLKFDDKEMKDSSSIRFYQFIAAIESNFNVKVSSLHKIRTFKDLTDNIS